MAVFFPAGALVRRELLSTLRGMRSFLILGAFVLIGAGYGLAVWPDQLGRGGMGQLAWAGIASRNMISQFSMGLLVGSMLFIPAYAASAIVTERERATFDFLTLSMIRPSGVVFAKLANALGLFLLILVGMAPVFCLAFFLIGVDQRQFLQAIAFVAMSSVTCASLGLYASCHFRKSLAAIGAGYLGIVLMMIGPIVVTYIGLAIANSFFFTVRAFEGYIVPVAIYTIPPVTLLAIFRGSLTNASLLGVFAYHIVLASIVLFLTTRRLGKPMNLVKVDDDKPLDDAVELMRRRTSFPYYLIDPLRRKKTVEDHRNPMMVREIRWGLFNRATLYVRAFYCSFVLYFFLGVLASFDARTLNSMGNWLLVQIVVTVIVAPALMSNTLTKEYELRNLDMLRMTLMRPKEIILGKMFAGILSIVPVLLAAVLSCAPMLYLGVRNWPMLVMGYGTLFVCSYISLSLGLFASLITQRTSVALGLSYIFGIVVFAGGAYSLKWANTFDLVALPEHVSAFLSPITAFIYSSNMDTAYGAAQPAYNFVYWMANMACSTLFACALVGLSVAGFHKYRMQDR